MHFLKLYFDLTEGNFCLTILGIQYRFTHFESLDNSENELVLYNKNNEIVHKFTDVNICLLIAKATHSIASGKLDFVRIQHGSTIKPSDFGD